MLFAIIAIIVLVLLVLIKTGVFKKIHIGGDGHRVDTQNLQDWLNRVFGTGGGDKEKEKGS